MKLKNKIFTAILAVMLFTSIVGTTSVQAANSDVMKVKVNVQFGQTEARNMLAMVNECRKNSETAWFWNEDDTTKTTVTGAQDLVYDYNLEKIAMQRAVETALSFSHTRTDGTTCFTCTANGTSSNGENLAAGNSGTEATYLQWREDEYKYAGQGHRRNMLNTSFKAVGIAHVIYNGVHYWVQEFGVNPSSAAATTANNSTATVEVDLASSQINTKQFLTVNPISIKKGTQGTLPTLQTKVSTLEGWPTGRQMTFDVVTDWTVTDETIASIVNGKIQAKKVGTTTLVATVDNSVKVNLTVTESETTGNDSGNSNTGDTGSTSGNQGENTPDLKPGNTNNNVNEDLGNTSGNQQEEMNTNGNESANVVVKEDEKTNILLEITGDVLPSETKLVVKEDVGTTVKNRVKKVLGKITTKYVVYDISLLVNEQAVQPNGKVRVAIPIPKGYNKNRLGVYRVNEDGSKVSYDYEIEGDYAIIETDHFSTYVVAELTKSAAKGTTDDSPVTASVDYFELALYTLALAGMGILVTKKIK